MPFFKKQRRAIFYSRPALSFISYLMKACIDLLFATFRIDIKGKEHLIPLSLPNSPPLIVALWHNQMALAPVFKKLLPSARFCIVVSNSRDGKLLAHFAKRYPQVSVIYVRHNRRHQALLQMCELLEKKEEIMLITPDGPRGPKYEVKPGVIYSAQKSGASVVAMHWQAKRMWEFSTWDKMRLPKPFSRITMTFEEPLICKENIPSEVLEQQLSNLLSSRIEKENLTTFSTKKIAH